MNSIAITAFQVFALVMLAGGMIIHWQRFSISRDVLAHRPFTAVYGKRGIFFITDVLITLLCLHIFASKGLDILAFGYLVLTLVHWLFKFAVFGRGIALQREAIAAAEASASKPPVKLDEMA